MFKKKVLTQYFNAYSKVIQNAEIKETIKSLERQIAFGRSMIVPAIIGGIILGNNISPQLSCAELSVIVIVVVGIILMIISLPKKQKAIYRCVFENYEYV